MKLDLKNKIVDYLMQNAEQKFTVRDLAEWVFATYPAECEAKKKRSDRINSDDELIQQIVNEIHRDLRDAQKSHAEIKTTAGRPRKYYYTTEIDQDETEKAEAKTEQSKATQSDKDRLLEDDLYPKLMDFLWGENEIVSKRINEGCSSNRRGKGGNKWLHPDVVAMEDLTSNWNNTIKDCVDQYSDKKAKLWSFEVKRLIKRSDVRELFFQAVSNSSWANNGYLVATELEDSAEKELRILSALHGIGFILLNPETPRESQILILARERPEINWAAANRLAKENSDFKKFIKLVTDFYKTGDTDSSYWDTEKD